MKGEQDSNMRKQMRNVAKAKDHASLRDPHLCKLSWQESQFWNQTFDDELAHANLLEIRELLDEDANYAIA